MPRYHLSFDEVAMAIRSTAGKHQWIQGCSKCNSRPRYQMSLHPSAGLKPADSSSPELRPRQGSAQAWFPRTIRAGNTSRVLGLREWIGWFCRLSDRWPGPWNVLCIRVARPGKEIIATCSWSP